MSIAPVDKFIILMEDVALPTKIFMGKNANLVKFIWLVKYFFNVFVADVNLKKMFFRSTCRHLFYYGGLPAATFDSQDARIPDKNPQ